MASHHFFDVFANFRASERMFDAAQVPASVRQQYWVEFERMIRALQRQAPRQSLEALVRGERVMSNEVHILTAAEMRQQYASFFAASPIVLVNKSHVPRQFWPLLPYAEFWGIADDWTREELVASAPLDVRENLRQVVAAFDSALDEWLAGPAADESDPSDEYVAFSAMRIAAYSA